MRKGNYKRVTRRLTRGATRLRARGNRLIVRRSIRVCLLIGGGARRKGRRYYDFLPIEAIKEAKKEVFDFLKVGAIYIAIEIFFIESVKNRAIIGLYNRLYLNA